MGNSAIAPGTPVTHVPFRSASVLLIQRLSSSRVHGKSLALTAIWWSLAGSSFQIASRRVSSNPIHLAISSPVRPQPKHHPIAGSSVHTPTHGECRPDCCAGLIPLLGRICMWRRFGRQLESQNASALELGMEACGERVHRTAVPIVGGVGDELIVEADAQVR